MNTFKIKGAKIMTKIVLKSYLWLKWKYVLGKKCAQTLCQKCKILFFRSEIFLRSAGSSWSMNINLERVIEDRNKRDIQNTQLLENV